jgi:hypothetical protein
MRWYQWRRKKCSCGWASWPYLESGFEVIESLDQKPLPSWCPQCDGALLGASFGAGTAVPDGAIFIWDERDYVNRLCRLG